MEMLVLVDVEALSLIPTSTCIDTIMNNNNITKEMLKSLVRLKFNFYCLECLVTFLDYIF